MDPVCSGMAVVAMVVAGAHCATKQYKEAFFLTTMSIVLAAIGIL